MSDVVMNEDGKIVYLGIGSNIDPETNIFKAIKRLKNNFEILSISRFWESAPVGRPGPMFLNGVVAIQTNYSFLELKKKVREIEKDLGRVRSQDKFAPRQIDIDILIFAGEILDPEIWTQPYVACPLAEVYPSLVDPITSLTINDIARILKESEEISPRIDLQEESWIK